MPEPVGLLEALCREAEAVSLWGAGPRQHLQAFQLTGSENSS